MYVYAQVGISLPHNAAMQYGYGSPVSRDQLDGRRPCLLRRARPRRHLHRWRIVRPRAPHRRRREDLEPLGFVVRVDVRRRSPSVEASSRACRPWRRRRSVLLAGAPRPLIPSRGWKGTLLSCRITPVPDTLRLAYAHDLERIHQLRPGQHPDRAGRRAAAAGHLVSNPPSRVRNADQAEALLPVPRAGRGSRRARQGLGVLEGAVRPRRGV